MRVPWWLPFGRVDQISTRELYARLTRDDGDLQLLDVREELEFRNGHIAGAKNVPIHVLPRKIAALGLDTTRPVIAICLSGHRSIPAYRLLKRAGFGRAYSLKGGMFSWWRGNLPITRDASG